MLQVYITMGSWERLPFENVSLGNNALKSGSVYCNPTPAPNCSYTGTAVDILPALLIGHNIVYSGLCSSHYIVTLA